MEKRFLIIDSNSVIHRAYHALPPLTTKKGEPVNAVYGFLLVFLKSVREFQPGYIAACFDVPGPTFRHKEYREYKATRPPTPKDLVPQIIKTKDILKSFSVPVFEKKGFEADDIIGTLVRRAQETERIIISGDKDILQLIGQGTEVYLLRKGVKDTVLYDEELFRKRFQGLKPEQVIEFKGLRGDPSDNIPGVSGIGEKTAINLLKSFGTINNLYREIKENTKRAQQLKPRIKKLLLQQEGEAVLSRLLASIKQDVAIDFDLERCRWDQYSRERAAGALQSIGFQSLVKRLPISQKEKKDLAKERNMKLW